MKPLTGLWNCSIMGQISQEGERAFLTVVHPGHSFERNLVIVGTLRLGFWP